MKFWIEKDVATGEIRFGGTIEMYDFARIRLDRMDQAVIDTPADTAADHLQSLEILYRRHAEQASP